MKINTIFIPAILHSGIAGGCLRCVLFVVFLLVATGNALAQAHFELIDGLRYLIGDNMETATLVANPDGKYSGDIVVPEKVKAKDEKEFPVTKFGDKCFYECFGLTSITIPSSVTSLGESCFQGCYYLTSVTIPSSVTSLGEYCFFNCVGLTSVTIPSSVTSLGESCFSNCSGLTSITIPSSVTSLGESCFYECYGLTNITIPSSVTSLGKYCFFNCVGLTSVTIPSSVTSLGESCFSNCSGLTSITIPSSVTSLGKSCFSGCSGLTSITIPSSVTYLWSDCFSYCINLESIYFDGKLPKYAIKSSIPTTCIIYVPKDYLQDYKEALGSKYQYIYARTDGSGDDKPRTQCDAPIITYSDGKLHFSSSTIGAEYHYTITDADMANDAYSKNGKVVLIAVYNISVYATANGYQASDKATATLYWINANFENDPSSNINQLKIRGIVVTSQGGVVILSGLVDGEVVRFFAPDGKQVGSTKAVNGIASYAVAGSMLIAKVGNQSIKVKVEQ